MLVLLRVLLVVRLDEVITPGLVTLVYRLYEGPLVLSPSDLCSSAATNIIAKMKTFTPKKPKSGKILIIPNFVILTADALTIVHRNGITK